MYSYILPICILIIVIVLCKLWRSSKKEIKVVKETKETKVEEVKVAKVVEAVVYAVNDDGNFDLADVNGKLLNIGFGPNPKVYINLLYQAEKDVDNNGVFISKVGNFKLYEIGGRNYTVNFTRLI